MTSAEYQREYRARQGAVTGQVGRRPSKPCGTPAGYKRHRYNNELPCVACSDAYRAEQRDMYRRRKSLDVE